ncbi:MAG: cobalamin biosynthesis protein [Betaproteobacteria bacterium]|nr:cobalamin biosynthesis protein [Betaproteobacteria bacterium]
MSLFATLAALAWEHARPSRPPQPLQQARRWHGWLLEYLNAGGEQHGVLAWTLGVGLPALAVLLLQGRLEGGWEALGWAAEVAVLYFCLGFRPGMGRAAAIAGALMRREIAEAQQRLHEWRPGLRAGADVSSLARQTVEELLRLAMGRLFGVLFWFFLLGAAGAVLYLLTREACSRWHGEAAFGAFSARVQVWLDWLPARMLAFSFAIVGNFQDAMDSWRSQARAWGDEAEGAVLAAGAGALGLRLGGRIHLADGDLARPDLGLDEAAGAEAVSAAEALIWRALLLWLAALALLWLGGL